MRTSRTAEQLVRDILEKGIDLLEHTDHKDPQRLTAGDVVELANAVRDYWPTRDAIDQEVKNLMQFAWMLIRSAEGSKIRVPRALVRSFDPELTRVVVDWDVLGDDVTYRAILEADDAGD